ncbi:MAG: YdbH domain-containing protein, partial [Sphingomonadaceae bacterium]|nr:YdbH domain-containing protein [Sphingomonadaceae bacterium]
KANLAAAFGPVEGLSGEIHFTDLINLVTAPGQEVRIASVNPGVEVREGVVRYRLEAGQKVRIEGGGWPFSGGQLVLLPTTMDFSADVDRYLTFRVIGLDAGAFIQAMELKNVSATGTFDGLMPLIFNAKGGRVSGGVLVARQQGMPPLLMPEGVLPTIPCDPARQSGVLSYVGPVSNEQLGAMGRMAFDALKDLQYKCLTILMDGALDGEMVTNVVFNGVNRGQIGGAPAGLARNFVGLPFIFNVRIAAPFRGLLGTAQSLIDPTQTVRDEVGKQAQEKMRAQSVQGLAVQPAASDKMPEEGHQ